MILQDIALIAAGCIGSIVAIIHGVLVQKLMVKPVLKEAILTESSKRLLTVLMQFSTTCWFVGGLALVAAPFWFNASSRLTTIIFVGGFYIFGAIGNFWGTKGKHPGWILLATSVILLLYSTTNPNG